MTTLSKRTHRIADGLAGSACEKAFYLMRPSDIFTTKEETMTPQQKGRLRWLVWLVLGSFVLVVTLVQLANGAWGWLVAEGIAVSVIVLLVVNGRRNRPDDY